jgi:hypothetical protein
MRPSSLPTRAALAIPFLALWFGCNHVQDPTQPSASPQVAAPKPPPDIDPDDFVSGVDNRFFPLVPGTTFFYEGESEGVPTRDVFFVTHRTLRIMNVRCIEVHDQAYDDGVLVEDTLDWFAQDIHGNVWYFGEDTKELDPDGNVISTEGSWLAGRDDARPGIVMLADPQRGDTYQQEVAPDIAEDTARVLSREESVTVPYGSFDHVLLTKEWTPLDRSSVENKYYADGIGFILGIQVKGALDVTRLVDIRTGG